MACFKLNCFILLALAWLLQSSFTPFQFLVHGRKNPEFSDVIQGKNQETAVKMRSMIGSSPPRCFERCKNCGHCEAIQVPVVPTKVSKAASGIETSYYRSDNYNSNYKPMCWKCKCGDLIFNP